MKHQRQKSVYLNVCFPRGVIIARQKRKYKFDARIYSPNASTIITPRDTNPQVAGANLKCRGEWGVCNAQKYQGTQVLRPKTH